MAPRRRRTRIEAARNAGINVDTLLASNEHPAANPFAKLLGRRARMMRKRTPTPTTTPVAAKSKPVVLAGLDPKTEKKPALASAVTAKVARAVAKLTARPHREAPARHRPATLAVPPPRQFVRMPTATAPTPNQIILARGYWEGPPDGMAVANPLAEVAYRRSELADADPDSTGAIGPLANASDDRPQLDPRLCRSTRASASSAAPTAATGIAALRAAAIAAQQAVPAKTTIAVKRAADQVCVRDHDGERLFDDA